jgi:hypothetical protein
MYTNNAFLNGLKIIRYMSRLAKLLVTVNFVMEESDWEHNVSVTFVAVEIGVII